MLYKRITKSVLVLLAIIFLSWTISYCYEIICYAYGVEKAITSERSDIKEKVKEWSFLGLVVNKIDNRIVISANSFNTPEFLPKEYVPPFSIELSIRNIEKPILIELTCPDYMVSNIQIGDKVEKKEGNTFVVIDQNTVDLVDWE